MGKLTDPSCRNAVVQAGINPDTGKPYGVRKLADGGGLFLFVSADGSKRWRYRYFVERDGRKVEQLMSLGVYPDVTLAAARVAAAKAALLGDPGAARKAVKEEKAKVAENTFESLALAWHGKHAAHWAKKHADDILKRMKADIFPTLGQRPVADIRAPEIVQVLEAVQARGTLALGWRVLGHINKVLGYAQSKGLVEFNVAVGREDVLQAAPYANHAHVQPDELPALLKAIDQYDGSPITRLALRMLSRVFVRATELLGARWDEFDLANATWEIPASRMKMKRVHIVPLAPAVVAMLEELRELGCGSEWVFPGRDFTKSMTSKSLLHAFEKLGYAGVQTSHGFRHIASTALNEARDGDDMMFEPDAIERQLAHVTGGTRGRYNKAQWLPERRRLMAWYADFLDEQARK